MGIVRDLYYARKMSAGLKLPAPTVALLIKRLRLAAAMGGGVEKTVSGSPAHITDALAKAALSVLASIEPIQDLHGYATPWPGGGGKNLLDTQTASTQTASFHGLDWTLSNNVFSVSGNASQNYCSMPLSSLGLPSMTLPAGTYRLYAFDLTGNFTPRLTTATYSKYILTDQSTTLTEETTFSILVSSALGTGTQIDGSFKLMVVDTSTGEPTEWQPYSNICPITGRTGVSVYRTGKNLLSYTPTWLNYSALLVELDKTRATFLKGNTQYMFSFDMQDATSWRIAAVVFDENGDRLFDPNTRYLGPELSPNAGGQYYVWSGNASSKETAITTIQDCYVMLFFNLGNVSASTVMINPMLEIGSTVTNYAPYTGSAYAFDWTSTAGTVYGGTLDVVTGKLTVDRVCVNLSASWYWYIGVTQPTGKTVVATTNFPEHNGTAAICSHYKHSNTIYIVDLQLGEFIVSDGGNGAYFCFKNESGGTAQEFKDIITAQETAGTPIQVCYELATPLTYQLTAQEVQMLLGENYVWSSSGDTVSVTYYAEGNANPLQSLNILLGGNYSNPKTADDVSDKEALEIILGGNK